MRFPKLAAACTLTLLAIPAAAVAQDATCYSSPGFVVAALENTENPGTRFSILPAGAVGSDTCRFDAAGDYVIGDGEDPIWFAALAGNMLVLSRSTGPQGDLVVHDLASRKIVLDVPADDFTADPKGITFWERAEEANASNCPEFAEHQANGLGAVISLESRFDFTSAAVTRTGKSRCDATQ